MAIVNPRWLARVGAMAVFLAGCVTQPSGSAAPSMGPTIGPTAAPATPPAPTGIWTTITTDQLPPGVVYQVQKLDPSPGGHGGAPDVALPPVVAIDYRVSGTCDFAISLWASGSTDPKPAASFERRLAGETVQSTWQATIKPGLYQVTPSDADGCTWIVTVRTGT